MGGTTCCGPDVCAPIVHGRGSQALQACSHQGLELCMRTACWLAASRRSPARVRNVGHHAARDEDEQDDGEDGAVVAAAVVELPHLDAHCGVLCAVVVGHKLTAGGGRARGAGCRVSRFAGPGARRCRMESSNLFVLMVESSRVRANN